MKIHQVTVTGVTLTFDLIDKPGFIRRDGRQVVRDVVQEMNQVLAKHMLENNPVISVKGVDITSTIYKI